MKKCFKWLVLFAFVFALGFTNINALSSNKNLNTITLNPENDINVTASIPTRYDLRDYIDIGVENQNPYGICFAYASLTSLETYLALNYGEYYDFSELHFALSLYLQEGYYDSIDHALNDGGNFAHFALYTQKDKSLVLESEMPKSKYTGINKYSQMQSDFNNINNNFYSVAKVNDTIRFDRYVGNKSQYSSYELTNFRNGVKNHIMKYGSLTAGIHSNNTFTNSTINYKITDDSLITTDKITTLNTNHLISIVGWDD
ncbi:MAG: hypothetical protein J6Q15_02205, partial [Clostridia bacterium]|nr:hypothetical protein [Clostridia bacterium]